MRTGGRSMIVDPWGIVLAQAPDFETFILADLDFDRLERDPHEAAVARQPRGPTRTAGPRRRARESAAGRRQAAADPRRRGPRLRAPGLPHLPGLGHRGRGRRRLRARLPLLPVQGRGARHAVRSSAGS